MGSPATLIDKLPDYHVHSIVFLFAENNGLSGVIEFTSILRVTIWSSTSTFITEGRMTIEDERRSFLIDWRNNCWASCFPLIINNADHLIKIIVFVLFLFHRISTSGDNLSLPPNSRLSETLKNKKLAELCEEIARVWDCHHDEHIRAGFLLLFLRCKIVVKKRNVEANWCHYVKEEAQSV